MTGFIWILCIPVLISAQVYRDGNMIVKERIIAPFDSNPTKPAARNAPFVQSIDKCEYSEFYLDLLKELNKLRSGVDEIFAVCMSIKLMWAAKIQSDHQALVREPTHAGPRLLKLGSVEERIAASKFNERTGIVAPEELIYYWPRFPEQAYGKERRKILASALQEMMKDAPTNAILKHPGYRFFGAALTRRPDGKAFMTIVLADSKEEQCHVCYMLGNGVIARKYAKETDD
jgi:hypothetical protein